MWDTGIQCGTLGKLALHAAAEKGHMNVLRALIAHGVDVCAVDYKGNTAVHSSSPYGMPGTIDVLVEAGANVNARNEAGRTPLHRAAD